MSPISQNQSKRQTRALDQWLTESTGNPASAAKAHEAVLAHPCAHHVWPLDRLWNELADELESLGRHDDAAGARARGAAAAGHDPARATSCDHCGFVATGDVSDGAS